MIQLFICCIVVVKQCKNNDVKYKKKISKFLFAKFLYYHAIITIMKKHDNSYHEYFNKL